MLTPTTTSDDADRRCDEVDGCCRQPHSARLPSTLAGPGMCHDDERCPATRRPARPIDVAIHSGGAWRGRRARRRPTAAAALTPNSGTARRPRDGENPAGGARRAGRRSPRAVAGEERGAAHSLHGGAQQRPAAIDRRQHHVGDVGRLEASGPPWRAAAQPGGRTRATAIMPSTAGRVAGDVGRRLGALTGVVADAGR